MSTRFFSIAWWGSAEPIYLTALPYNASLHYTGTISDVRYINITALSENGVLMASTASTASMGPSNVQISGVIMEHVSITLAQYSNITRACHDFRPGPPPALVSSLIDGVWGSSARALIADSSIRFMHRSALWGECVNSSLAQFHQVNVRCHLK